MSERRIEYVRLDDVQGAARNPRRHDTAGIRRSVARFGLAEVPLMDERTGRLVAGHGRINDLLERRSVGADPPDGVRTDNDGHWLVPVIRGWKSRTDAEAEAYLVASNKLAEVGGWDEDALNELLTDLANEDYSLARATGWSEADLEALLDAGPDFSVDTAEPVEHTGVPSTGARYAESQEQFEARSERLAAYEPRTAGGLTEMVLVYPLEDRDEAARLIAAARGVLGSDLKGSEVVLRALRTMIAVLDNRHNPQPVTLSTIAKHAGWEPDTDA